MLCSFVSYIHISALCQPECEEYEYCRRDYDDYDYTDYDYECVCNYGFTGGAGNCTGELAT